MYSTTDIPNDVISEYPNLSWKQIWLIYLAMKCSDCAKSLRIQGVEMKPKHPRVQRVPSGRSTQVIIPVRFLTDLPVLVILHAIPQTLCYSPCRFEWWQHMTVRATYGHHAGIFHQPPAKLWSVLAVSKLASSTSRLINRFFFLVLS